MHVREIQKERTIKVDYSNLIQKDTKDGAEIRDKALKGVGNVAQLAEHLPTKS